MREFFTIAIFKIKADIRMNKTTLNSQKEKHFMLSLRRATPRHRRCTAFRTYFYPRPPCGERLTNKRLDERERNFYPRSPCGERPADRHCNPEKRCISIHALLAESDVLLAVANITAGVFLSTLSLRRATPAGGCRASGLTFLSTLSLRRATCRCHRQHCPHSYFYPRSPGGERRLHIMIKYIKSWRISIHALLAESDNQITLSDDNVVNFYPRSPCGERL